MIGAQRLSAGLALAMAISAPVCAAEHCATGPRIEGKYTIDAQGLEVRSTERMKLVAVCGYRKNKLMGGMGTFRFQGNVEVNGTLRRDVSETFGEVLWFTADEANAEELAQQVFMTVDMRAPQEPGAKRIVPLAGNADCLMAPARLRILAYEYVAGPGTDEDGPFLLDYEVVRVGKSKKCTFG